MNDRAARVRVNGPLAQHAAGFRAMLAGRGYAPSSAAGQLQAMAHLSRWLEQQGRTTAGLRPQLVERFVAARKSAGYQRLASSRAVAPLTDYLAAAGLMAAPAPPAAGGVLAAYRDYLLAERGLAASTVRNYLDAARLLAGQDGLGLESLTGAGVSRFVLAQCRSRSTGSAAVLVTGLRSLLRYLYLAGVTEVPLAEAVPSVAPASPLPPAAGPGQASLLLESCDRRTAGGLRDYAVLVVLARLGLRAGEVAAMRLGDIDWRAGQVTVRGKGRRLDQLPLTADAGQAIADWLRGGRPECSCRNVFTTLLAPLGPLTGKAVSAIVKRAGWRAGIPAVTAHQLRHGTATALLRAGASLPEVGQVLRHASLLNTARYARVDHGALSAVARPWPGAGA
jgi:integrase/recombinase XerD